MINKHIRMNYNKPNLKLENKLLFKDNSKKPKV